MANFKQLTTLVPDWANWCAVDKDGDIYVFAKKPKVGFVEEFWRVDSGDLLRIGLGPKPKDWTQELYELEYIE